MHTPHTDGQRGRPVQPGAQWLDEELAAHEGTAASEHLARLAADIDLRDRLMLGGYAGREWERFARSCIAYAHPILWHWIRSGKISWQCRRKRARGAPCPMPRLSAHDVDDLVQQLLALAIRKFRSDVLIKGRWRPGKGASLKTFFIGKALLLFPTVFRDWRVRFGDVLPTALDPVELEELALHCPSDVRERQLDAQRRLHRLVSTCEPVDGVIVQMTALRFTAGEIAEELALNPKTVETRLRRYRHAHADD